MSRGLAGDDVALGAEPRVDLLPPEVKAGRKGKTLRRGLAGVVLAVVVIVVLGIGVVTVQAAQSQSALLAAQVRTAGLVADQAQYVEVREMQRELDATVAARTLGSSTEIDWKAYLAGVRRALPEDVTIDTVSIDATSPLVPFEQAAVPLQSTRVASLTLGLTTPTLPTIPEWLLALQELPGYADGTPESITRTDAGAYIVIMTLHINAEAFAHRFSDPAVEG